MIFHQFYKEGVDSVMGGKILDYEAKRIRNESNIEAVYNMLVANVDESVVQRMYPEQFEAGKKRLVLLAWDPDFTKLTPEERSKLDKADEEMKQGEYFTNDEIWN